MEQEYTISTGWKIFMISVAVFLIGFSFFLFSMGEGRNNSPLMFLIPVTIIAAAIWLIVQQVKSKVIISEDSITRVSAFSTKEIAIKDIKGCRIGQKVIVIESLSPDNSKIVINNYDVLTSSDELVKYLRDNFKNQDAVDLENERNRALEDSTLGSTKIDRENSLKKAKGITIAYNVVGAIVMFSTVFLDNTKSIVILLLCYPLLGIVVMIFSKGLMKFLSNNKRSVYGFTMLGIMLPAFVLLIKSLFEYTLIDYAHLWLPFLLISAIFFVLLFVIGINKTVASVKGQMVVMLIAGLIYGLGSTIQINCLFDSSNARLIHTTIDSKWIEYSKGTHYHIKISSWDSDPKPKDMEVSKSTYDKYSNGNSINVDVKSGLLNIPWFYINV